MEALKDQLHALERDQQPTDDGGRRHTQLLMPSFFYCTAVQSSLSNGNAKAFVVQKSKRILDLKSGRHLKGIGLFHENRLS